MKISKVISELSIQILYQVYLVLILWKNEEPLRD